jgi:hypothetical protein
MTRLITHADLATALLDSLAGQDLYRHAAYLAYYRKGHAVSPSETRKPLR